MTADAALAYDEEEGAGIEVAALILKLRGLGIVNHAVLKAIETVPRPLFVPKAFRAHAFADCAVPIECGQTIAAPSAVARMTAALEVSDLHSVLEIGTGSGYQAAVLARLARRVTTIERFRTLVKQAERHWVALGLRNVSSAVADGALGWSRQAPFDRILVSAAFAAPPARLLAQLEDKGILIAPIGAAGRTQRLTLFSRSGNSFDTRDLGPAHFLPIVPGVALAL
jgi:protein-L-isoaspartate(D-aspartate) O-methyltransferase